MFSAEWQVHLLQFSVVASIPKGLNLSAQQRGTSFPESSNQPSLNPEGAPYKALSGMSFFNLRLTQGSSCLATPGLDDAIPSGWKNGPMQEVEDHTFHSTENSEEPNYFQRRRAMDISGI
jgi:hypothetical protein